MFSEMMAPSNLHLDILMGRDETIEPVDIFGGTQSLLQYLSSFNTIITIGMETGPPLDPHKETQRKRM
jgi:proteasome maturation protein